jgi:hypothetical protein
MSEQNPYERPSGAFAGAAAIDHVSDAVVRNPLASQTFEYPSCRHGAPTSWTDFQA